MISEPTYSIEDLTEHEMEILDLVARGMRNSEIGKELSISPSTVKNHMSFIFKKLGVRSRSQATAMFVLARSSS